ncbi:MAG: hypothetical protein NC086_00435 [Alistipes sp.]|nr:hypothetical protein [Alistipes sp.]
MKNTYGILVIFLIVFWGGIILNPLSLFGAQFDGETEDSPYEKGGLVHMEVLENVSLEDEISLQNHENNLPSKYMVGDELYWKNFSGSFYYEQMPDKIKKLWKQMEQACILAAVSDQDCSFVSVQVNSSDNFSRQEIVDFILIFKYSNPQYYFLSNKMFINSVDDERNVGIYLYEEFKDGTVRKKATEMFTQKMNNWIAVIQKEKYDEDKLKAAHDIIVQNTKYGYGTYDQSAYSMVCEGVTVCAGYTAALQMLLNAVGIETAEVTSDSHSWNIVRLHDYWYNVDVTWADSTVVIYDYYNKSDVTFRANTTMHDPETIWDGLLPEMKYDSVALKRTAYRPAYIQDGGYDYFIINDNLSIEAALVKVIGIGGEVIDRVPNILVYGDKAYSVTNFDELLLSVNGLNLGDDGIWHYYNYGLINDFFVGMAENEYGWWYITDGQVNWTYTGMAENEYGWWYYHDGQLDWDYTGMTCNEYGWWYYRNGRLDWDYTGMACNEYGWWYYRNGRLDWDYTGMACNEYGWWYYRDGQLDWDYTGMAENEYGWWYYSNGMIDWSYTGFGENQYGQWYFENGRIVYD